MADRQYAGRQVGRQVGRQADRQTGRQADRQTGRQTDRQTDRQTKDDRWQIDNMQVGRQTDRQRPKLYHVQADLKMSTFLLILKDRYRYTHNINIIPLSQLRKADDNSDVNSFNHINIIQTQNFMYLT